MKFRVYKFNHEGQLRFWKAFDYFPEALLDDENFHLKFKIEEVKK
jgi:hypothetical protein